MRSPQLAAFALAAMLCVGLTLCAVGLGIIGWRPSFGLVVFGLILSWASLRVYEASQK